jgi:hypothetical protein
MLKVKMITPESGSTEHHELTQGFHCVDWLLFGRKNPDEAAEQIFVQDLPHNLHSRRRSGRREVHRPRRREHPVSRVDFFNPQDVLLAGPERAESSHPKARIPLFYRPDLWQKPASAQQHRLQRFLTA